MVVWCEGEMVRVCVCGGVLLYPEPHPHGERPFYTLQPEAGFHLRTTGPACQPSLVSCPLSVLGDLLWVGPSSGDEQWIFLGSSVSRAGRRKSQSKASL